MSVLETQWTRFAAGLSKLAVSCRQEADDLALETYVEALADQIDPDLWETFVRESIRSGRYEWFPKTAELLRDVNAWMVERTPPKLPPIRPSGSMWESPMQEALVVEVVRANPKGPRESPLQYIHRIAILSGLVKADEGERMRGMPRVESQREPGQEG